MSSMEEQVLRTTKEVVVKFIEVGRISPAGFDEFFKGVYKTVVEAIRENPLPKGGEEKLT